MQSNSVQIDESLTAGIDLDMVIAEYDAIEKVVLF